MGRDIFGHVLLVVSILGCLFYLILWAIPSGTPDMYFIVFYLFSTPIIGALLYMRKYGKSNR
jgi:hypothetical protein